MKLRTSIMEKAEIMERVIDLTRGANGEMSCFGLEVGRVYHIIGAYYGDIYNVKDPETGINSIILTYENIMDSGIFDELLEKNKDARRLNDLIEKRYNEVFQMGVSDGSMFVKALEDVVDKMQTKTEFIEMIKENKEFLNTMTDEQKEMLDKAVKLNKTKK